MGFVEEREQTNASLELTPEEFGKLLNGHQGFQMMYGVDGNGIISTVILSPLGEIKVGQSFTIKVSIKNSKKPEQE